MGKPQLVEKKNSLPLNEMGDGTYYFSVLDLKDEDFINEAKNEEEIIGIRTLFLDSKCRSFRRITMSKSINHQ